MIRSTIGIIVFCVFLGSNAASSNPSFIDTISIPGAKCIISIPMDSNSLYSSFKHPCSNYYFFKLGNRCPCCRYSNLLIHFSSTVKCTLFVKSVQFREPFKQLPSDTLPISCDSLIYYFGFGIASVPSRINDFTESGTSFFFKMILASTTLTPLPSS